MQGDGMKSRIQRKLTIYFLITTFLIGFASIFSYFNSSNLIIKMRSIFEENVSLNSLLDSITHTEQNLQVYFVSRNQDVLVDLWNSLTTLEQKNNSLQDNYSNNENRLMLANIQKMVSKYVSAAESSIKNNDTVNKDSADSESFNTTELSRLIRFAIDDLLFKESKINSNNYFVTFNNVQFTLYVNIAIIAFSIVINIFLTFWFTRRLSGPLLTLSKFSKTISLGNFDIQSIEVESNDEIGELAQSFNIMVKNTKEYIENIKEKANIEKQLRHQEKQNAQMKNLLKTTELLALQAQINPHFLYNTLNAGSQLAILEGADRTGEFLINVSDLFRYNLSNINLSVSLEDELKHVDRYIYILNTRFPQKINFVKNIDARCLDIIMPRMILQPIIENAYIHGISEKINGGTIAISIEKKENKVLIMIQDDGVGMDSEQIEAILSRLHSDSNSKSQSSGIGIGNIVKRLQLFYSSKNVIRIESRNGEGTKVIINIPLPDKMKKGGVKNV